MLSDMDPTIQLMEELLWESKFIGSHRSFHKLSPEGVNPSGTARATVRQKSEHGFRVLQGTYRKEISEILGAFANGKLPIRKAGIKIGILIHKYFEKAFVYGMHIQAGKTGTPRDGLSVPSASKGWVSNASKTELGYFRTFLKEVKEGKLSNPQTAQRVEMYVKTLEFVKNAGKAAVLPAEGIIYYWVMNRHVENCKGCQYLSEQSPFTKYNLPAVPKDGSTPCLSNCACTLVSKRVETAEFNRVKRKGKGKAAYIRSLKRIKGRRT